MIKAEELRKELCKLISASDTNLGVEITVPLLYPDGEHVTVVVSEAEGGLLVSDHGFGALNLAKEGLSLSKKSRERLAVLTAKYHCSFVDDRVQRYCSREELPIAIMVVANASRTIGDQAIDVRHRKENEFKALVTELLIESVGDPKRVRLEEEFKGFSGRKYKIDNVILDRELKAPRVFVESIHTRNIVLLRAAQVQDLKRAHGGIQMAVALDDEQTWKQEDRKILEDFGADEIFFPPELKPTLSRVFLQ
jgi:Domain of unknown function DUF1828.